MESLAAHADKVKNPVARATLRYRDVYISQVYIYLKPISRYVRFRCVCICARWMFSTISEPVPTTSIHLLNVCIVRSTATAQAETQNRSVR